MDKEEYLYLENIKNINKFISTEEFKLLKKNNRIEWIKLIINEGHIDGNKIYQDPDEFDEELYNNINERRKEKGLDEYEIFKYKYMGKDIVRFKDNNEVILSLDCVIGWKAIIGIYVANGEPLENFVNDYQIIRNPQYAGHLIWPCHKYSINQRRYNVFNDRVDYTLFDIKNYFENSKHKINYDIKNTKEWLDSFKCDKGKDFDNFIEKMDLKRWCIENEEDVEKKGKYKVRNIETGEEIIPQENGRMKREDYTITKKYLKNLIKIITGNGTGQI